MQRSNGRHRVASEFCFDFLAVFEHAAGILSASETGRRSKKAAGITSGFLLHCLTGLFRPCVRAITCLWTLPLRPELLPVERSECVAENS